MKKNKSKEEWKAINGLAISFILTTTQVILAHHNKPMVCIEWFFKHLLPITLRTAKIHLSLPTQETIMCRNRDMLRKAAGKQIREIELERQRCSNLCSEDIKKPQKIRQKGRTGIKIYKDSSGSVKSIRTTNPKICRYVSDKPTVGLWNTVGHPLHSSLHIKKAELLRLFNSFVENSDQDPMGVRIIFTLLLKIKEVIAFLTCDKTEIRQMWEKDFFAFKSYWKVMKKLRYYFKHEAVKGRGVGDKVKTKEQSDALTEECFNQVVNSKFVQKGKLRIPVKKDNGWSDIVWIYNDFEGKELLKERIKLEERQMEFFNWTKGFRERRAKLYIRERLDRYIDEVLKLKWSTYVTKKREMLLCIYQGSFPAVKNTFKPKEKVVEETCVLQIF